MMVILLQKLSFCWFCSLVLEEEAGVLSCVIQYYQIEISGVLTLLSMVFHCKVIPFLGDTKTLLET